MRTCLKPPRCDRHTDVARIFDCGTRPVLSGSTAGRSRFGSSLANLFDTLYHAVAFEEGATLITADERYYDKASVLGNIVLLGDFSWE